jgi:EmrB/QacA subfamily drug resistance transporter
MAQQPESTPHGRWILAAVILGSGIVFLDSTIVNVALPRMGRELPATIVGQLEGQAYITSGYLAVLSALLILAGALADRHGRRRIFSIGLASFGTISALCGLAPTMESEVVFRLLQGAAGALLVPGSLSIITANFSGAARGRAFGIWAAATSALAVLGPLVGGTLVDTLSWRVAFLINVPLVLVALFATRRYVPESRDESSRAPLDLLGSAVVAIAVGGVSFGLIRGQERDWQDGLAFASLGVGLVAAVVFPILMIRRPNPLIPPALFRVRNFTVINIATFLVYSALYVTQTLQSLFLQGVLGYSALAASLVGLPVAIMLTLGSTKVGTLGARFGPRPFLVAGPTVMALGMLWWGRISASSQGWVIEPGTASTYVPPVDTLIDVLPAIILFGIGITLVVAPLTTALMNSLPVARAGLGSAINNAISRVGYPFVLAVLFIAVSATFYGSLASRTSSVDVDSPEVRAGIQPLNPPTLVLDPGARMAVSDASTDAFHLAMLACAGLLLSGAVVSGVGLRGRDRMAADAVDDASSRAGLRAGGTSSRG